MLRSRALRSANGLNLVNGFGLEGFRLGDVVVVEPVDYVAVTGLTGIADSGRARGNDHPFRAHHIVGVAIGHNQTERAKRLPPQQATQLVRGHTKSPLGSLFSVPEFPSETTCLTFIGIEQFTAT